MPMDQTDALWIHFIELFVRVENRVGQDQCRVRPDINMKGTTPKCYIRWQAMKMMADGSTLSISDLAQAMQMGTDGVGKHLIVLRNSGIVEFAFGEDARCNVYSIPKRFLREPGVIDFGFCVLRFPVTKNLA